MSQEFSTPDLHLRSVKRNAMSSACPSGSPSQRRRRWPERPIPVVLALVPAAMGSWLLLSVGLSHLPHLDRDYTLPVRAQVVESHIIPGLGPFSRQSQHRFIYRYIYKGRLFRASAYRPGGHLDEAIRSHPVGSMLTVYLDPEAPKFSMVWPGLTRDQIDDLCLGLALIAMGVGSLFLHSLRRRCRTIK